MALVEPRDKEYKSSPKKNVIAPKKMTHKGKGSKSAFTSKEDILLELTLLKM